MSYTTIEQVEAAIKEQEELMYRNSIGDDFYHTAGGYKRDHAEMVWLESELKRLQTAAGITDNKTT